MHQHLLGIQEEDFDFTLDAYANKLDDQCFGIKDLKEKYHDEQILMALYEDFIIDEINSNDKKYKIGDIVWVYPTYYTSRMYLGFNNIVLDEKTKKKRLEVNECYFLR